jgi:hypothetical protein
VTSKELAKERIHIFQGSPKHQGQKTNQDVGFDALGFLVVNGSKGKVAF